MVVPQTQEWIDNLVSMIKRAEPDILELYPVQGYIALLDTHLLYGKYLAIPDEALTCSREIARLTNEDLVEAYHKLILLSLIEQFEERRVSKQLPLSIITLFHSEFARIIDEFDTAAQGYYLTNNNRFLSDLALCRLKVYPCGHMLIDRLAGVPRSILMKGSLKQIATGVIFFLFSARGFRPYYELHFHPPQRNQFNPESWIVCYQILAELLEMNPSVKGVFCSSWWYDPQLETISPRLKYLSIVPAENGARIFYYQTDKSPTYGATVKSETRKKLFEAGKYIPQVYMMIWPRRQLIAWSKNNASQKRQ